MANTYSQILFHIVFAVKSRDAMLAPQWSNELYNYIGGTITSLGQIPIAIGGYYDHIHILVKCKPIINIPCFVKDIKLSSNHWIQPKCRCKFRWQDGYSIFSVSTSHKEEVSKYILNQYTHHTNVKMVDEMKKLLELNGIEYDERYLPQEIL